MPYWNPTEYTLDSGGVIFSYSSILLLDFSIDIISIMIENCSYALILASLIFSAWKCYNFLLILSSSIVVGNNDHFCDFQ